MRGRTLAGWWAVAIAGLLVLARPGAALAAGPWVWPLDGPHTVSRPFDPPATSYGPGHRGADLPGLPGQAVYAAGAGRVSYAGMLAGRGVVVVVHGDLRTTYEPVIAVVHVGQPVTAGQVLGRLAAGHAGCHPACLHWGLLRGDVYLDPVGLVRRGPSRLLPLDPAAATAAAYGASPAPLPSPPAAAVPDRAVAPALSLRAADAATAGGALAALIVGLALLRQPPRPPHRPVTPATGAGGPTQDLAPAVREPHASGLVDLTTERHRRRPEVA